MKALFLALIIFTFNAAVLLADELNVYNFNPTTQGNNTWISEAEQVKEDAYLRSDVASDVSTSFGFGDFIVGLKVFVDNVYRAVFFGATLELFGVPKEVARLIAVPLLFLYAIALAQFVSNRGTKSME